MFWSMHSGVNLFFGSPSENPRPGALFFSAEPRPRRPLVLTPSGRLGRAKMMFTRQFFFIPVNPVYY